MPKIVQKPRPRISCDTETSGKDLRHGCQVFFVTSCNEAGEIQFWEWDVDPLTRKSIVPKKDVEEISKLLASDVDVVFQNPKYDMGAFETVGIKGCDWSRIWDTLLAGHLLASNQPHDLTTMCLIHLGINIKPFEDALKEAVNQARRLARSKYPDWRIAKEGLPELPSCKSESADKAADGTPRSTPWANDMWLPRAVAMEENYPDDHPWWTVLRDYSNADSEVTLKLFAAQEAEIKRRGLWGIYLERLKVLPVIYEMEASGVTLSKPRLEEKRKEYSELLEESKAVCLNIASSYGYELSLPKGASNNSLYNFVFTEAGLNLKSNNFTDTGKFKFDKFAVDEFLLTLPQRSKSYKFIQKLKDSRSCSTALSYMESYEKYWTGDDPEWKTLYPSVNPTGTDTLRMVSAGPNEQQISKKEGFNLRYLFGPLPEWEWWSLDYENLELRIPAYEAGEESMIELFERPNDPPYFGSNHLLFAHLIHDNECSCVGCEVTREATGLGLFEDACRTEEGLDGRLFKKKYTPTWYSWTKNGDFAVQYSAVATSGTADRAYHVPGAQLRIEKKLGKIAVLNEQQKYLANSLGYVETISDREVSNKGYPLLCHRGAYGKVKATLPLSYHVQGTACWIMMRAMIKVNAYLKSLNDGSRIIMNVHDEIVLAMRKKENKGNLPKIEKVKSLMSQAGDCVGVPLTVGVSYCPNNWAEAV